MNEKRVNKKVTMTVPIVLNELFLGESFHGLIQDVRLYSTFMAGISFQDNPASKLIELLVSRVCPLGLFYDDTLSSCQGTLPSLS